MDKDIRNYVNKFIIPKTNYMPGSKKALFQVYCANRRAEEARSIPLASASQPSSLLYIRPHLRFKLLLTPVRYQSFYTTLHSETL